MAIDTDLLVVGAGAKGTAIAMKTHVLNSLGLGPIGMTLVEATGPAAAWVDGDGVTTSREVLAITPSKDVGYPYQSTRAFGAAGADVDIASMSFSWQRYLIEKGDYSRWVDAGEPSVQRREYGAYLAWVLTRATDGVNNVTGRVARLSLSDSGERWIVDVAGEPAARQYACKAFALTGPGVNRVIAHDPQIAQRVLDCDSGRMAIAHAPIEQSSDIAIIGGGESALSCVEFARNLRPDARITVYTANLPLSRLESFLENRVFSSPDDVEWETLSVETRRDFINHTDRGVFGPDRLSRFAYDERCRFVLGRVRRLTCEPGGEGVCVNYESTAGADAARHDYVINSTGFDLLGQLRSLLAPPARRKLERVAGALRETRANEGVDIGRFLELRGVRPWLQVPGLAGLSQGPGFATLGSLGLVADRILEPLIRAGADPAGDDRHRLLVGDERD
ncbi:MAG TPA: SidA/IucD/PvdA family monooxygenase [Solirubrobacteraceae bacterium]|nr:SidA/IucD/PvdA family monooxygenase [Solirubrobacteraceae bacterium]